MPFVISTCMPPNTTTREGEIRLPGGVRLNYLSSGTGDTPVVLLHGYGMSSVVWEKILKRFPSDTHVLALDMRGFGRSEKTDGGHSCAGFADDLAEFLDAMKIAKAVLVGHSFGGLVAQHFAARHPERLLALVISNGFASTLPPKGISEAVADRINGYVSPEMNRSVFASTIHRYFDAAHVTPEDIDRFVEIGLQAGTAALKETLKANYTTPAIPASQLGAFQQPVLIVVTTHDPFGTFDQAVAMSDALPNSRIQIIPRCGHTPMWERPSEFTAVIIDFLKSAGLIKI